MAKKIYILNFLVFHLMICLPFALSQERQKSVRVTAIDTPPKIDGSIGDECWSNIRPVSGFFQFDPINGAPASEETHVWIAYDADHLYFAFFMKDAEPDKIWMELTPRNTYENNDSVSVILDTYNDRRTSVSFTVNPKGVQKNSVETIWESAALIKEDGWTAEMAIPFKSLRFTSEDSQTWGINFERYINRLDEKDFWTDVKRDIAPLLQMGELRGISGVRPGYNLEFFPYAGFRASRWEGDKDDKVAAGLDFKYGILPNLYLDITASPDFSEVESDPFIYQLSPYENYLRENRPFFSEGSQYFRLSTERSQFWRADNKLFYSRRIGSPRIASKLSGKTGGYSFGVVGALNDEDEGHDAFYSVVRVQKDIFKNSQIGIFYAGMNGADDHNRNFAVDYSFNLKDVYYIRGMSAISSNKHIIGGENAMHVLQLEKDVDAGLQIELNFQRIERNVDIRTGYVNKIDAQSTELRTGYAWRYNQGTLKRFSLDLEGNLEQDSRGNLMGNSLRLGYWTEFFARFTIHGGLNIGKSKYQAFDDDDNLFWTDEFIDTLGGDIDFRLERGGLLKEVSIEAGWDKRGIYNEEFTAVEPGKQVNLEAEFTLRPRSNFEWSFSGDWVRQTIDGTGEKVFDGMTYATGLHLQITRNLFVNTRLLGETRDRQYNLDFLVGYYFGAGNIIQLSFKKNQRTEDFIREGGYSITLKVSYLLRI